MNCKQTEELLPLYAGRDLEEKRATLVTEHLLTCVACARVADEYCDSVQWTERFAPPDFSEAVYAGIRQRVLREIGTEAMTPAWSQTIAGLFRSRLTWAIASALLIVIWIFAIYFIVNRRHGEQQLAERVPAKVQPGTKERFNSAPEDDRRAALPHSVDIGGEKRQFAAVPQRQRRKKSRSISIQRGSLPELTPFPAPSSAALTKPLRVEIQTKDPTIRIIWFVQPETKPVNTGSKGT